MSQDPPQSAYNGAGNGEGDLSACWEASRLVEASCATKLRQFDELLHRMAEAIEDGQLAHNDSSTAEQVKELSWEEKEALAAAMLDADSDDSSVVIDGKSYQEDAILAYPKPRRPFFEAMPLKLRSNCGN